VNFGNVVTLKAHNAPVTGLLIHPSQSNFISASRDGSIKTWCLESFYATQQLETGSLITELQMGWDSNFLFTFNNQQVGIFFF